jgi:two-component system, chemotaxis family, chemotaxis protein CheY
MEGNRKLIKSFLHFYGYEADLAEDGLLGKKAVTANRYDLIFSDIEMPNMNGFEFLQWVRSDASRKSIPMIMLSTLDSPEVISRCTRLGASAYIVKPFTKDKVDAALKSLGLLGA